MMWKSKLNLKKKREQLIEKGKLMLMMESMDDDRLRKCRILYDPLKRKCENTTRVDIYPTGAGVTTVSEGAVVKEIMRGERRTASEVYLSITWITASLATRLGIASRCWS